MALQATEQGSSHPPAAAAAAPPIPIDHPLQPIAAPPSPPAGGEGCPTGSAVAGLPDDLLLEILSRLPVKPLSRFNCVSKAWSCLVADCLRKIPPTLQGFFYSDDKGVNNNCEHFFNLLGRSVPPVDTSFAFLTELPEIEQICLADSCNGLLLFLHTRPVTYESKGYIVCNPATREWVLVPSTGTQCEDEYGYPPLAVCYLIFDPAVSSGFKLVQFLFGNDNDMTLLQVHTYSSESREWSGSSVECWSHQIIETWVTKAFVNGMLHLAVILRSDYQVVIAAVDGEGEKRRVIPWPEEERGSLVFIGQSKGLLHCTSGKKDDLGNMTELLISVLENYDTDRWILKDSVSCLQLFGEVDCSLADSTVAFHPDHNMVFFFHIWNRKLVSYDMDSKEVSTLCTLDGWWLPITPYSPYFVKSSALAKKE